MTRVCIEMIEGWYGADVEKLERVLHPELAKRGIVPGPAPGEVTVIYTDKAGMIAGARSGTGRVPRHEWGIEARVLMASERLATVEVVSRYLRDVCQIARIQDRWQIVNVIWEPLDRLPWS